MRRERAESEGKKRREEGMEKLSPKGFCLASSLVELITLSTRSRRVIATFLNFYASTVVPRGLQEAAKNIIFL